MKYLVFFHGSCPAPYEMFGAVRANLEYHCPGAPWLISRLNVICFEPQNLPFLSEKRSTNNIKVFSQKQREKV
jgi:hypothetical protein